MKSTRTACYVYVLATGGTLDTQRNLSITCAWRRSCIHPSLLDPLCSNSPPILYPIISIHFSFSSTVKGETHCAMRRHSMAYDGLEKKIGLLKYPKMYHSNFHTTMMIFNILNKLKHISSKALVAQCVHPFRNAYFLSSTCYCTLIMCS